MALLAVHKEAESSTKFQICNTFARRVENTYKRVLLASVGAEVPSWQGGNKTSVSGRFFFSFLF